MNVWALLTCSILYLITAIDFVIKGNPAMGLVFLSYTVANLGFIWVANQ